MIQALTRAEQEGRFGRGSVEDPDEKQPSSRGRPARAGTVPRCEYRRHVGGRPSARTDVDQRADNVPDHVAQEPVPFHANDRRQCRIRPRSPTRSIERSGPSSRRQSRSPGSTRNRGADDQPGGFAHRRRDRAAGHVPRIPVKERRDERAVDEPVLVDLPDRAEPRVEACGSTSSAAMTRTSGGRTRVERARERGGIDCRVQSEGRDLRQRVDAGIGPAGPVDDDRRALDRSECILEQTLDRDARACRCQPTKSVPSY